MIEDKCKSCLNYLCKDNKRKGGFKYWGCYLHWRYGYSIDKRTPLLKDLVKAAKKFLPEYESYWDDGTLYLFVMPFGTYNWTVPLGMKQYKLWRLKEFHEGYMFGLDPIEPFRDVNPYKEPERNHTWDCGYLLGLHESEKKNPCKLAFEVKI